MRRSTTELTRLTSGRLVVQLLNTTKLDAVRKFLQLFVVRAQG